MVTFPSLVAYQQYVPRNAALLIPIPVYSALDLEESIQSALEVIAVYTEVILGLCRA